MSIMAKVVLFSYGPLIAYAVIKAGGRWTNKEKLLVYALGAVLGGAFLALVMR